MCACITHAHIHTHTLSLSHTHTHTASIQASMRGQKRIASLTLAAAALLSPYTLSLLPPVCILLRRSHDKHPIAASLFEVAGLKSHLLQTPLSPYTVLSASSSDVAITNNRSLPLLLRTLCMCIMAIDRVNVKIIPVTVRACTQTDRATHNAPLHVYPL